VDRLTTFAITVRRQRSTPISPQLTILAFLRLLRPERLPSTFPPSLSPVPCALYSIPRHPTGSNFEIASLDLWRSPAYRSYFDFLDKSGGFFYERWGDGSFFSSSLRPFPGLCLSHLQLPSTPSPPVSSSRRRRFTSSKTSAIDTVRTLFAFVPLQERLCTYSPTYHPFLRAFPALPKTGSRESLFLRSEQGGRVRLTAFLSPSCPLFAVLKCFGRLADLFTVDTALKSMGTVGALPCSFSSLPLLIYRPLLPAHSTPRWKVRQEGSLFLMARADRFFSSHPSRLLISSLFSSAHLTPSRSPPFTCSSSRRRSRGTTMLSSRARARMDELPSEKDGTGRRRRRELSLGVPAGRAYTDTPPCNETALSNTERRAAEPFLSWPSLSSFSLSHRLIDGDWRKRPVCCREKTGL
jgi:hypothetical protein